MALLAVSAAALARLCFDIGEIQIRRRRCGNDELLEHPTSKDGGGTLNAEQSSFNCE
jgi:hypothetical protein